ncbi:phage tail tube protein [Novacetimonas hansenii]|uniref:Tail tube protein n=1 Tax=Novacetimonas hansenii TaxID=436 RepID=A0ABQ0SHH7_NOVHA|nr:phage tail tube protein [Novacetimonas hansenii]GAN84037.1 hypothetical protein Gaha_0122_037 [Novacetimonas hansenii JCM 7643]GBQ55842.1 hypothetical protein AA0243_1025 [Novacetimonas hansenii NRIC 0243]GEC64617.1 hypothetical protein GHA01_24660 [Novacetimonas hansenii]
MAIATKQSQGVSEFTINGVPYDVIENVTWNVVTVVKNRQVSLMGVENVTSYEPTAAKITVTVRWLAGVAPSAILTADDLTVQFVTRNNLQVIGKNCFVQEVVTQDPVQLTSEFVFSCESITETPIS